MLPPPRREGKDQLSVMRVGTGHGDSAGWGRRGGAHMGPRKLQLFPGVCGLWAVAGPIVLWKGRLVLRGAAQLGGRQWQPELGAGGGGRGAALTGKEIDQILRKTIARACCCRRRIGVTSWLAERVTGGQGAL